MDDNKNVVGRSKEDKGVDTEADTDAVDRNYTYNASYAAAKELAESYADLLKQKEDYQNKLGSYPHYTLDDAYYLLSQGSHEQSERVQTSGTSDPVAKAVLNAEKVRDRLNREMDVKYQKEVVEPYLEVCEKTHLFDICMNMLDSRQHYIAAQLYIQRKPQKYVVDIHGAHIPRKRLLKETESILNRFAEILDGLQHKKMKGGVSDE